MSSNNQTPGQALQPPGQGGSHDLFAKGLAGNTLPTKPGVTYASFIKEEEEIGKGFSLKSPFAITQSPPPGMLALHSQKKKRLFGIIGEGVGVQGAIKWDASGKLGGATVQQVQGETPKGIDGKPVDNTKDIGLEDSEWERENPISGKKYRNRPPIMMVKHVSHMSPKLAKIYGAMSQQQQAQFQQQTKSAAAGAKASGVGHDRQASPAGLGTMQSPVKEMAGVGGHEVGRGR